MHFPETARFAEVSRYYLTFQAGNYLFGIEAGIFQNECWDRRFVRHYELAALFARPAVQPRNSRRPDVGVRQTIGIIFQRGFEIDELVTAFPEHRREVIEIIGIDEIRMDQQRLADLPAKSFTDCRSQ